MPKLNSKTFKKNFKIITINYKKFEIKKIF